MERKKKTWKLALYGAVSLVAIIVVYVAYQGIGIYNALDGFEKNNDSSRFKGVVDQAAEKPPEWEGRERVNVLLLGADARGLKEGEVARSDSMLVASIDPVTKQAHLLSILRDTYANIPGYGKNRVNTAITLGGPNVAMQTIGDLLGLDIQYYVYADFEGFKALVDAIGGVDYEVEKNMKYVDNADGNRYDIDLKKGYQRLDGDKALQYVRFRHDAMSDFTRTERQRNFMAAVAKKLQSTWNLVRMKTILEQVQPYIETNLQVSDMLKLGQLGLKVRVAGSAQVPPMDLLYENRSRLGAVLDIRDEDKLREYVRKVLSVDTTAPAPAEGAASGADGAAGQASDRTSSSGNDDEGGL